MAIHLFKPRGDLWVRGGFDGDNQGEPIFDFAWYLAVEPYEPMNPVPDITMTVCYGKAREYRHHVDRRP